MSDRRKWKRERARWLCRSGSGEAAVRAARLGGTLAGALVLALGLALAGPGSSDEAVPRARQARSLRELAQLSLMPRASGARRESHVQRIRAELLRLREALQALEADPSPEATGRALSHRASAAQAVAAWASAAQVKRAEAAASEPQQQEKQAEEPIQARLRALWPEIDEALADPVGQRARLASSLQRLDEALEGPAPIRGNQLQLLPQLSVGGGR